MKTYSQLIQIPSFDERVRYLRLDSSVGIETFGFDRYLNQKFYHSIEWKRFRRDIILRDKGCDLGLRGYDIFGRIIIHHMNPITIENITNYEFIMNRDSVICVSHDTHNLIHYTRPIFAEFHFTERKRGDTKLW